MPRRIKQSKPNWPKDEEPEADVAFEMIDLFTSPTVCLTLGKSKARYHLHKDILTSKCPYFVSQFRFYEASGSEKVEQLCALDDCDHPEAFKIFIMYLYLSRYEVPSGMSVAEKCILHVHVYVLAERLCMDDLKAVALKKMSTALREGQWDPFSVALEPSTVVELLRTIYSGTQDNRRWSSSSGHEDEETILSRRANINRNEVLENLDEAPPTEDVPIAEEAQAVEDSIATEPEASLPEYELAPPEEIPTAREIELTPEEDYPILEQDMTHLNSMEAMSEPGIAQDEMRRLICQYVALKLKYFRSDAKFMAELMKGGPVVADIIDAIP